MIILCAVTPAQMNVAEITGEVQDMAGGAIIHGLQERKLDDERRRFDPSYAGRAYRPLRM